MRSKHDVKGPIAQCSVVTHAGTSITASSSWWTRHFPPPERRVELCMMGSPAVCLGIIIGARGVFGHAMHACTCMDSSEDVFEIEH